MFIPLFFICCNNNAFLYYVKHIAGKRDTELSNMQAY